MSQTVDQANTSSRASTGPAASVESLRPILEARGLSKRFRMGEGVVDVLRGCDFVVREGEFVAIEGRSGSGKSTLLHILGALDVANAGTTAFDGRDYTRRPVKPDKLIAALTSRTMFRLWIGTLLLLAVAAIVPLFVAYRGSDAVRLAAVILAIAATVLCWIPRLLALLRALAEERPAARLRNRAFGFVFQFYYLLPELDVVENVMLTSMVEHPYFRFIGKRRELRERAIAILTDLGMSHRLEHRPQQLSGGERQRVAIARALMNQPRVLFADEPTGNLDYETGRQIMGVLERLHREQRQTIIMVTHDRALARTADRVLVLKAGRLEDVTE